MAENVLETRIQLRYGTYSEWMNSNVILRLGEAAVCAFPRERVIEQLSNTKPDNTQTPMKIDSPEINTNENDGILVDDDEIAL